MYPRLSVLAALSLMTLSAQPLLDPNNYFVLHNQFQTPNRVIEPGTISGSSVPIGFANKTGAAKQQWFALPNGDGSFRITTRDLGRGWSLEANDLYAPATMRVTDTSVPGQRWRMVLTPEPCLEFYNDARGPNVELDSSATAIHLAPKALVTGQCWTAQKIEGMPAYPTTPFFRIKASNGQYMHMQANDGSTNGALQVGSIQSNWQSAQWDLYPVPRNILSEQFYLIRNRLTFKHLFVGTGNVTAVVAQEIATTTPTWWWRPMAPSGSNPFRLESASSNKVIDYSAGQFSLLVAGQNVNSSLWTLEPVNPPPQITTIVTTPSPVVVGQTFQVTVNGTNFDPASATVKMIGSGNGSSCSPTPCTIPNASLSPKSATALSFNVDYRAGTYLTSVINGDGQESVSMLFEVMEAIPVLTSFTTSPATVVVGQPFTMTIVGRNFVVPTANIGERTLGTADFSASSSTSLTTKPITLTIAGSFPITVRNSNGNNSNTLTGTATRLVPVVSSATTSTNPAMAMQPFTVTLTGSNFDPATATVAIVRNSDGARTTFSNAQLFGKTATQLQFTANVPGGIYMAFVTNGDGQTSSNPGLGVFTVAVPTPVLSGFTTSPSPVIAGQPFTMTITGTGFLANPTAVIGPATLTGFDLASVTATTVVTKSLSLPTAGSYPVRVRNEDGQFSTNLSLTVNGPPVVTPTLTSLSTSPSPAVTGQLFTLTINGTGFDPAVAQVYLSGAPVPTSALTTKTATQLAFSTTLSLNSYQVTVRNGGSPDSNALALNLNSPPPPVSQGAHFVPLSPCRAADTRTTSAIPARTFRDFTFGNCGVPSNATAVALNVTLVPNGQFGFLSIWPAGQAQPGVSTMNSLDGRIKANAAIVGLGTNNAVSIYVTDTAHIILDVNGYFVPAGTAGALAFYPVTPCRVVDTRQASGGGILPATATRRITGDGSCLPPQAQAYSLNVTAVPPGPLGFLTLWPDGSTQPVVSTLNNLTGTVVANAAILRAGTGGAINAYVTDASHLVVDLNGYFAPPGQPGALAFYPLQPCRIFDTRNPVGAFGGPAFAAAQMREFSVPSSSCNVPATALAYVTNATVLPSGVFGFLTMWQGGVNQPTVSTLNAIDGALTSNAAILPASSTGVIRVFASSSGNLLLDISGYFAP